MPAVPMADRLRTLRIEILGVVGVALAAPLLSRSEEPRSHTEVRCVDLETDVCPSALDDETRALLADEGCTAVEVELVVPVDSGDTATTSSTGTPTSTTPSDTGATTDTGTEAVSHCCYVVRIDCGTAEPHGWTGCRCATSGLPIGGLDRPVFRSTAPDRRWTDASQSLPRLADLTTEECAELAQHWACIGLTEHASIAAFESLARDLRRVGAPRSLVRQARAAAGDEARHARTAFTLAGAFAGAPVGPERTPLPRPRPAASIAELAGWVAVSGCAEEAVSVGLLLAMLEGATDPAVRSALEGMIDDEARHVALQWKILAWCLDAGGPDARSAAQSALARVAPPEARPAGVSGPRSHGWAGPVEVARSRGLALDELVWPLARALVA